MNNVQANLGPSENFSAYATPPSGVTFHNAQVIARNKGAYDRALGEYTKLATQVQNNGFVVTPLNLPAIDYSRPLPEILEKLDQSVKMAEEGTKALARYNFNLIEEKQKEAKINQLYQSYMNPSTPTPVHVQPQAERAESASYCLFGRIRRAAHTVASEITGETRQHEIDQTFKHLAIAALTGLSAYALSNFGIMNVVHLCVVGSVFKHIMFK